MLYCAMSVSSLFWALTSHVLKEAGKTAMLWLARATVTPRCDKP